MRWLTLVLLCAWIGSPPASGAGSRIAPGVRERLAATERVEVAVALRRSRASLHRRSMGRRVGEIAQRRSDVISSVVERAGHDEIDIRYQFATASGFTASVSRAALSALAEHPSVSHVELLQEGSAALANSVPHIRADIVRTRGIDGSGVTVAVLDSAIDTSHPDLEGLIVAEECFCASACCPGQKTRLSGPGSATGTGTAHGTHVTGIIGSQGDNQIASIGVAPGVNIVAIRVLDDRTRGSLADWVAALDWLAVNHPEVRVVNMSLVSDRLFPPDCDSLSAFNELFRDVIDTLREQGTLVFAAAGNNGDPDEIAAPACVTQAVAVGAVDGQDTVASFSNSSLALDLLAPGVSIRSTAPRARETALSGTSMATPHAVGVAALLWNAVPELGPNDVEEFLRSTGLTVFDPRNGLEFPRVDALASFEAAQFAGTLIRGGGDRLSDCLVEWTLMPRSMSRRRSRAFAVCRDGDPTCDQDDIAGQCTFELGMCFNVPDGRIAHCRTNDPVDRVTLRAPREDLPDPIDAGNAAAVSDLIPTTPIHEQRVCTETTEITVPIGNHGRGGRMLSLTAESIGRRDSDRVRLICLAD